MLTPPRVLRATRQLAGAVPAATAVEEPPSTLRTAPTPPTATVASAAPAAAPAAPVPKAAFARSPNTGRVINTLSVADDAANLAASVAAVPQPPATPTLTPTGTPQQIAVANALPDATRLVNHETGGHAALAPTRRLATAGALANSNAMISGPTRDALDMRDRMASVDAMQRTGQTVDEYRRGAAVNEAQGAMKAAGVNADDMASVGLGPKAHAPLPTRQFYGGPKQVASPVVASPGVAGAADITQADVIRRMLSSQKNGRNTKTFEQAKTELTRERATAAAPIAEAAAVATNKAQQDQAARTQKLEERRAAIRDKYKPVVIDEEVPNIDAVSGKQNPLQPTTRRRTPQNPEYSDVDKAELDEIERELSGQGANVQTPAPPRPRGNGQGAPEPTATGTDGKKIFYRNNQWVDAQGKPVQ